MKTSSLKIVFFLFVATLVSFAIFNACKNYNDPSNTEQTIIRGNATVIVDESVKDIVEDEIAVFESQYPAKMKQINKSETEVINDLIARKYDIAVLTRKLTKTESAVFNNKNIIARETPFATDAVVFITNKTSNDTLVDLQEVINLMQNKTSKINQLIFENPNSSSVTYMNKLAGITKSQSPKAYSLKSFDEVFEYVTKNSNTIGVVGLNGIVQPSSKIQLLLKNINVMAVKNVKVTNAKNGYYKPSQDNIGAGLYPLSRKVYMLNYQGKQGLGMGFASFVGGDIGQRIVLKSGLLPENMPTRIINLRKNTEVK